MSLKPDWTRDGVTLYLGDCLDVLPTLAAGSVDAVVTDPPYGTDAYWWDKDVAHHAIPLLECLPPSGPVALFGYPENHMAWAPCWDRLKLIGYVVWHYEIMLGVTRGLTRSHQDIAIWGTAATQIDGARSREPYHHRPDQRKFFGGSGSGNRSARLRGAKPHPDGRRCTDVWTINPTFGGFNAHRRLHPTQKPLAVLDRLVNLCSLPSACVLDFTMGSGTTGVACVQTGRRFIGIEKEPKYFDIAVKRIEAALADKASQLQFAEAGA